MPKIDFEPQEISVLRNMLDVALKQLGRPAVMAFAVLDQKLEKAMGETGQGERKNEPFEED